MSSIKRKIMIPVYALLGSCILWGLLFISIGAWAGTKAANTSLLAGTVNLRKQPVALEKMLGWVSEPEKSQAQSCAQQSLCHGHYHSNEKLASMAAEGYVQLRISRLLLWAQQAGLGMETHHLTAQDLWYRVLQKFQYAWGWAKSLEAHDNGVIDFRHVSYTTCPPIDPMWLLRASHLSLNTQKGWGKAWNIALLVKRVPVLYLPYLTFPLDNHRKTGWLLPVLGYSSTLGIDLRFPFYWNIAPNYDITLVPRFIAQRGGMITGVFRFLTPHSEGSWKAFMVFNDHFFATFKRNSLIEFASVSEAGPGLARLQAESLHRGAFTLEHKTRPSSHWSTHVMLNLVSDDYLLFDFGNLLGLSNTTHLLNIADAHYQSTHWDVLGGVQAYQTLHPVNQTLVEDLYSRLPFIKVQGDFPHAAYRFSYGITGAYVHFDHRRDFFTEKPVLSGDRLLFQPSLRFPMTGRWGWVEPKLSWQWTGYYWHDASGLPHTQIRSLPMVQMRARTVWVRDSLWGHKQYQQTLEPQFFYLWIPFREQDNIPVFDTVSIPFDWSALFREHRFIGIDRIGDANQISLGVASRFLESQTGVERFHARFGQIYYFSQHRVFLPENTGYDTMTDNHSSPFVAELQYSLAKNWYVKTILAWDHKHGQVNNSDTYFLYHRDSRHIVTLGYHFVRNGDIAERATLFTKKSHLNRFNIALHWPLTEHWYGVGHWDYNISYQHPETYYYGVEHQSCCWAMRMIIERDFRGFHADGRHDFEHKYYLQFQLKGLGHIGNSDPSHLLSESIPRYKDVFSEIK